LPERANQNVGMFLPVGLMVIQPLIHEITG
jgi:hypothetical protein